MAAITSTVLTVTPPGGRIVAARQLYGETYTLFGETLPDTGRTVTLVDIDDLDGWRRELAGSRRRLCRDAVQSDAQGRRPAGDRAPGE